MTDPGILPHYICSLSTVKDGKVMKTCSNSAYGVVISSEDPEYAEIRLRES